MTRPLAQNLFALLLAVAAIAPTPAQAKTPLKEATITTLRNRVRLKAKRSSTRSARARDVLTPGDRLTTGRSSLAEFRFNDGTLARMGELALFRFVPQKRNFLLNQGTVLLLIPPGKGTTRVVTPSVRAGIRGSALFIRHDPETNTTLVGALTNSGIEVSDHKTNQIQELKAGQMVVAVDGQIENLYDFDLQTFYETSVIAEGILQGKAKLPKVLEEIQEGLAFQADFMASEVASESGGVVSKTITNPDFVRLSANRPGQSSAAPSVASTTLENLLPANSLPQTDSAPTSDSALEEDSAEEASLASSLEETSESLLEDLGTFPGQAIGVSLEDEADEIIDGITTGIEEVLDTGRDLAREDLVGEGRELADDGLVGNPANDDLEEKNLVGENPADELDGKNLAGDGLVRDGLAQDDLIGDKQIGGDDDLVGEGLVGDDLARDDLARDELAGDDLARDDLAGDDLGDQDIIGQDADADRVFPGRGRGVNEGLPERQERP